MIWVFPFRGTKFQLIDQIKMEYAEYQTEVIPSSYYVEEKKTATVRRQQKSYRSGAYHTAGVSDTADEGDSKFC